ncbi:MAG: putative reductive dehalogenase subunit A [Candidatus Peregrinibacteria bacterium Greene0416_62]|nr:MAG: putative reductive dehalogenase subunit A [Candidatus Peregrinibacteria bacterium Greene0416_62]TSD00297.1 MAG: putative reductive dehalogenase subunit A [Candidatus Peregrinibacteria bacterium Greene1014_49]
MYSMKIANHKSPIGHCQIFFTILPSIKRYDGIRVRSLFSPLRFFAALLGAGVLLTTLPVYAQPRDTVDLPEPYKIPTGNPSNIDKIHDVTGEPSELKGEIYQDLAERAVCGGWNMEVSANGKIATVYGVPGRTAANGNPFTKLPSGMAQREESIGLLGDGYLYPRIAEVRGWSTACSPGSPPFFDDGPPCKQPDENPDKDNMAIPKRCEQICQRMNYWQYPIWVRVWLKTNPAAEGPLVVSCVQSGNKEKTLDKSGLTGDCCERMGDQDEDTTDPREKAPSCKNKYPDATSAETLSPTWDPYGPKDLPPDAECIEIGNALEAQGYKLIYHAFAGWHYCCTGARVRQYAYEGCEIDTPEACAAHLDPRRNCVRCAGDGVPTGAILPGGDALCALDSDCPTPLVCFGSKPEQVFATPCSVGDSGVRDCQLAAPRGNCTDGADNDGDGLRDFEDPQCVNDCSDEASGPPPAGISCRPWVCKDSHCTHPAIPGKCKVSNGETAFIDYNGELIPRPVRQETGCRGGYGAGTSPSSAGSQLRPGSFTSYFREYVDSGYTRDPVDKVVDSPSVGAAKFTSVFDKPGSSVEDITSRSEIPVACYGFYNEFDPKTRKTSSRDQRCVIAAYDGSNEFRTFYVSQIGHGDFGQEREPLDPDPTDTEEIRDENFDVEEDLWYQNLGGAFSLLNGKVFKQKYGQDLTFALMTLDSTLERARGPMLSPSSAGGGGGGGSSSTHGPDPYVSTRSPGALRRAFDDSVSNERGMARTIAMWWQQQETEAQKLIYPPVVHIIFPSAWSANLDLQETLLNKEVPDPPTPPAVQWSYEPQRKTMEVQMEVRNDLLGEVAALLESALIAPVRERSLPLIVPFGSATDFRAYKEGWIRWQKLRLHDGVTPGSEVDDLIDRLEEYAVTIDAARSLRAELPSVLGKALVQQNSIRQVIHGWLSAHLGAFQAFEEQRKQNLSQLREWQSVQKLYRDFHDITNMPWCKNDAFTTPVYSFLDTWLPGRPDLNGQGLPVFTAQKPEDLYIDLTAFEISTDTILIPVLKPVQILVNHDKLQPPGAYEKDPSIPVLPPLPPLPILSISGALALPMKAENGLTVPYPIVTPGDTSETIGSIRNIIFSMNNAYRKFWDAITKPRCGTLENPVPEAIARCKDDDPEKGNCCVIPGEEEFCRRGWGSDTCVHVEMDLVERFTRMGARPAVLLQEDFQVIGDWRNTGPTGTFLACDPADWACQDLHKKRVLPRIGWFSKVKVDDQTKQIDQWRMQLFRDTLQSAGSASSPFPYQADRNTITPSFDQRPSMNLAPNAGSSSS